VHLLLKERSGDLKKLRPKGFMKGGHKEKSAKDGDGTTQGGGINGGDNTRCTKVISQYVQINCFNFLKHHDIF
jgi:hypothetical protein